MTNEPTESETDVYEQLADHIETVSEELTEIERLSEEAQNPALERNAAHLRSVVQTLETSLPPQ